MKKIYLSLILTSLIIHAEEYTLGQGYHLNDSLNLGAYFSTEFKSTDNEDTFTLEDVAFLSYGKLTDNISFLGELETAAFYNYDFKNNLENINTDHRFHFERLYVDFSINDNLNIRAGKQITPIGIWNLEPINVLRDSSSNPLYIQHMFPQFITGLNFSGSIDSIPDTKYNLFGQKNKDLDEHYMNIANENFFGGSIKNESIENLEIGGSIGSFVENNNNRTNFIESDIKYEFNDYVLSSEWMISKKDKKTDFGGYVQGIYNLNTNYTLVGRYEYFNDKEIGKDQVGVIGFNYRPVYPVSFKGEYQFHSNDLNQILFSFSVLF